MTTRAKRNVDEVVNMVYIDKDHDCQRLLGKMLLRKYGTVQVAEDWLEGWSTIKLYQPNIVILDPYFYQPLGLTIMEELKRSKNKPYVVVVSSHCSPEVIEECIEAGANGFVTKPVKLDYFYRLIDNLIRAVIAERARSLSSGNVFMI